jgi:hypothetical protein
MLFFDHEHLSTIGCIKQPLRLKYCFVRSVDEIGGVGALKRIGQLDCFIFEVGMNLLKRCLETVAHSLHETI